ncbi:hypothetical protein Sme01_11200 [Sphaerisporangium melleum]|uniref:Uncharacterized protein n=1 Tax=Sphaerisporangium melleum TaxID=321316 RepID=A0A917QSY4_9ACTN|nr:hypothetical protein GCM10007964_06420 [Sphaerisporangium melleum]GII68644.1 hypothetical protein Sme01_11200 [Sphaerisporangium melleum]
MGANVGFTDPIRSGHSETPPEDPGGPALWHETFRHHPRVKVSATGTGAASARGGGQRVQARARPSFQTRATIGTPGR